MRDFGLAGAVLGQRIDEPLRAAASRRQKKRGRPAVFHKLAPEK
jgi:hypothetical protein